MKVPTTPLPVHELIAQCAASLTSEVTADSATHYAWWLIENLTKQSRASLLAQKTIALSSTQRATLETWLDDIVIRHKPLAYILGTTPFINLTMLVEPPTLIPRPETEEWVEHLIVRYTPLKNEPLRLLDLCTGTGCIALSCAKAFPKATVIGSDISENALTLARKNAQLNHITNATFVHSDLFAQLPPQKFDLILANPPYIAPEERTTLAPSVTEWEDPRALFADEKGLGIIKKIIQQAPHWLANNALIISHNLPNLAIEIGHTQEKAVVSLVAHNGYEAIMCLKDRAGKARVVMGSMKHAVPPKT